MVLDAFKIWRETKGIGKLSYNFRMMAYASAMVIVVFYHIEFNKPFGIVEYFTILIGLVVPQIILYRFIKSGKKTRIILDALSIDFFCVGWVIGVIDMSPVPSTAFALGAFTNHVAGRGLSKIHHVLLMSLGCTLSLFLSGFETNFQTTPLLNYLTIVYGAIHYVTNSYVLYVSIHRVRNQNLEIKQQRIEIEEKSEELKVLNESLKDINATLEQKVAARTQELELKNKKLEEYAFMNAHELRAPVTRVLGLVQLLSYENIEQKEIILHQLRQSATELDNATKDIRAKLEAES